MRRRGLLWLGPNHRIGTEYFCGRYSYTLSRIGISSIGRNIPKLFIPPFQNPKSPSFQVLCIYIFERTPPISRCLRTRRQQGATVEKLLNHRSCTDDEAKHICDGFLCGLLCVLLTASQVGCIHSKTTVVTQYSGHTFVMRCEIWGPDLNPWPKRPVAN
jgi:hypothetical protein